MRLVSCYNLIVQEIVYKIGDSLYLNITNRCTNQCSFCIRNKSRLFNQKHHLWLENEPSAEEILKAIGNPSRFKQIVFCGYGEPLIRLEIVKAVASALKSECPETKIRIDTNGHANLFWGRNILPELKGLIDSLSISLDTESAELYEKICHPLFGKISYGAILEFIKAAKQSIPEVEISVVDLPAVDKEKAKRIAKELGVHFRTRPYYENSYVK